MTAAVHSGKHKEVLLNKSDFTQSTLLHVDLPHTYAAELNGCRNPSVRGNMDLSLLLKMIAAWWGGFSILTH